MCKMISPGFFYYFFDILIFRTVRWVKGQKVAQNKEKGNHIHCILYLMNSIAYDHDFWYTCGKISRVFFILLKFSFFGQVRRVKEQKVA